MNRPAGVAVALAFLLILSACFLYAAYWLLGEVTGIDATEDAFFIADSALFACVGVWGLVTSVGVWRRHSWGRTSVLWLSCAVCLVYVPSILWYAYVAKTAPDVDWSWEALYPLAPLVSIGVWWLILFSRPRVKDQFPRQRPDS